MKWLQTNSAKLGKKYKNQWLLIGPKGVQEHSKSYSKIASQLTQKTQLIIKVPKNPRSAYFY